MKTIETIGSVIEAIEGEGVFAVYAIDREYDYTYLVCESLKEKKEFERLLQAAKDTPWPGKQKVMDALGVYSIYASPGWVDIIYQNGQWLLDPKKLHDNEDEIDEIEEAERAPEDWAEIDNEGPSGSCQQDEGGIKFCY